jgi:hypothetical protein
MTKATRPVVRGNPDIDKLTLDELRLLEMKIMDFKDSFMNKNKNLSLDTLQIINIELLRMQAHVLHTLSSVEDMKRVRRLQSTALVGGKRRKAKKVI